MLKQCDYLSTSLHTVNLCVFGRVSCCQADYNFLPSTIGYRYSATKISQNMLFPWILCYQEFIEQAVSMVTLQSRVRRTCCFHGYYATKSSQNMLFPWTHCYQEFVELWSLSNQELVEQAVSKDTLLPRVRRTYCFHQHTATKSSQRGCFHGHTVTKSS